MIMTNRHKVFVSFHHRDQKYKESFVSLMKGYMVDMSVDTGDINPNNKVDTIRSTVRDKFLRDTSVTVVLIGKDTWRRKHVDWEIAGSIRQTQYNSRTGLLGILLPTYPVPKNEKYNKCTIPPRLYDNVKCGFATIHSWSEYPQTVQKWIHNAFNKRKSVQPDNSYVHFARNRSASTSGWC